MNNEIKSENIVDLYVTPIMPIVLGKNFSPAEKFDAIRQSMESYTTSRISELEGKVEFYRRETSKLRDYLEEHKIGKPSQKLFDALYEHIAELEAENEKNIKWANDAETRAIAAEERIVELEAENKRLREEIENQQIEIVKKDEQIDSQRWIPVTERLPEPDDNVLCLTGDVIRFAQYRLHAGQWWYYFADAGRAPDDRLDREVTHWQPLPQPPKEQ